MRKGDRDHVGGLGLLLDRVAASLLKEFDEALTSWEVRNLHLAVLTTIDRYGPLAQVRICEYLGIERQTMANLVDELERRGLVERQPVAGDRRKWAVAITRKGVQLRQAASAAGAVVSRRVFAALTPAEQATLSELLGKLAHAGRYPSLFDDPTTR